MITLFLVITKLLERLFFEKSYSVELPWRSKDEVGGSLNAGKLRKNFTHVHPSKGKKALSRGTGPSLPNKSDGQKREGKMCQVLHDLWKLLP